MAIETNGNASIDRNSARYRLRLLGPFELQDGNTNRTPTGRRARAIIAMLAVAPHGMRGRRWLKSRLWSGRGEAEASASLRQCLSEIRRSLGAGSSLIRYDRELLRLDLTQIAIDTQEALFSDSGRNLPEFLEDLDIPDRRFIEWLADQRQYWQEALLRNRVQIHKNALNAETTLVGFAAREHTGKGDPSLSTLGTPIVAVLPPSSEHNPSENAHLFEGVSQELVDQLSRIRWIATISRSSSYAARNDQQSPAAFGALVGAHYVVPVHISQSADALRITTELLQVKDSLLLWSRSYEASPASVESCVRDIIGEIAGNLGGNISLAEQHRARRIANDLAQVNDIVWRGRWHINRLSREDSEKAEQYFRQALELEPQNIEAHVQLAWCELWRTWATRGSERDIKKARTLGEAIINLDGKDARGYWITATAEAWLRRIEISDRFLHKAIELCPSIAFAHAQLGSNAILSGQPERAMGPLSMALKLSPYDQQRFFFLGEQAVAQWMLGNYEDAVAFADEAIQRRPSYWYAHMIKFLSLEGLGSKGDAQAAREQLRLARPTLNVDDVNWLPYVDRAVNAFFIRKLQLAPKQVRTATDWAREAQ